MILLIDSFDSFTYNLVDYFQQLGESIEIIRNDEPFSSIDLKKYKGVVLSPGPERPEKAGNLLNFIKNYHAHIPVLGICLGHQALGIFFGATLSKAISPMHGKISRIRLMDDNLFFQIPAQIEVVRYHSLVLSKLPETLEAIAFSHENEIMAIKHLHFPIWGLQFHPEAYLTSYGLKMCQNWLRQLEEPVQEIP